MKNLVLITFGKFPKSYYMDFLKNFFRDRINIEGMSITEGLFNIEKCDLALITLPSLTNIAKKYFPKDTIFMEIDRTFTKGSLDKLNEIEKGKEVLLVNNSDRSAAETISLLHESGIKHIDFIPYYPNFKEKFKDVDIAVTPGQTKYVPDYIENVIDIGWRVFDVSTLMNIIVKLEIEDKELLQKIDEYSQKIIPINYSFHYLQKNYHKTKNELNMIIDIIDDGVLVYDKKNDLILKNKSADKILNIQNDKEEIYEDINSIFANIGYIENKIIDIKKINKTLLVTKRPIELNSDIISNLVILKDKSNIEKLERKLRKDIKEKGYFARYNFSDIYGKSKKIENLKKKAKKISKTNAPILIIGETGTGKELLAQSIHNKSDRNKYPFLGINCATLSSNILESELFGYEEGAFTGAAKGGKKGLFEMAHMGSLFLDEISELPLDTQTKLLRVIQEKEIMRIGGNKIIPVDVRIITASNIELKHLVNKKKFRKDLYYRLNVFTLKIPPLRERIEDIEDLILRLGHKKTQEKIKLSKELIKKLKNHKWEGNIRELENTIEYMIFMKKSELDKEIGIDDLPEDFNQKNYFDSVIDERFTKEENAVAAFILKTLKEKSCGRRQIYKKSIMAGHDFTEYKIRKMMENLEEKNIIYYPSNSRGAKISDNGR